MRLNDLDFHVEIEGRGPPLVLLHGFTGSVRTWGGVRKALTEVATTICLDVIGHGQSAVPTDSERYTLEWSTRDLGALLDSLGLEQVDLLGYSMGGRIALHFAVHTPRKVRRLVLESASPGIEDQAERRARVASDAALADRLVRDGIEVFVDEWERQPLLEPAPHVSAEARAALRSRRLSNNPLGLANSLLSMGAGQQAPLWARLPQLDLPVLLLVGQRDQRYRQIAERMLSLLPAAEMHIVPAAGHAVHLDQPARFAELVQTALATSRTGSAQGKSPERYPDRLPRPT